MEKQVVDMAKGQPQVGTTAAMQNLDQYDVARSSLLLSPIPYRNGATVEEQIKEVEKFLRETLEMPDEVLILMEIAKITRTTRGKDVSNEATVRFNTVSMRDLSLIHI